MELAPIDTLAKLAANHATKQAEEKMKALMQDALKLLREELRSEVQEVADAMTMLDAACARSVTYQEQKLAAFVKIQEEWREEFRDHKRQLSICMTVQEELKRTATDAKEQLASSVKGSEAGFSEVCSSLETSSSPLDEQSQSGRLECIKDAHLRGHLTREVANLRAELTRATDSALAHVDRQISDLRAHLLQMKGDGIGYQMLEMKAQMQEMRLEISERSAPPAMESRSPSFSNWEEFREATIANLQRLSAVTKDHVDAQLNAFNCRTCKAKDEMKEAKIPSRVSDSMSEAMSEFQELVLLDADGGSRHKASSNPIWHYPVAIEGSTEEGIIKQIRPNSQGVVVI